MVDAVNEKCSAETARGAHAALRAVLEHLFDRGLLDHRPPSVRLPSPAPRRELTITQEEAARLYAAAVDDDAVTNRAAEDAGRKRRTSPMAALVALLVGTGARLGETLALHWGADGVDLERATVTITRETTKTDAGAREIPVQGWVVRALRVHFMASGRPADGTYVFPADGSGHLSRDGRVRTGWKRVRDAAGLAEKVTPHTLRHSHATWLDQLGWRAIEIAARLGHSDPAFTTRRYNHASQERAWEAVKLLDSARQWPASGPPDDPLAPEAASAG